MSVCAGMGTACELCGSLLAVYTCFWQKKKSDICNVRNVSVRHFVAVWKLPQIYVCVSVVMSGLLAADYVVGDRKRYFSVLCACRSPRGISI